MKRAIIALAILCVSHGACHAEEQRGKTVQGSNHGAGGNAAEPLLPREQGMTREGAVATDPARAALEKERKHAIAIVEEALKKARERARREEEEARKKRLAEERQHAGKEKVSERTSMAQ